MCLCTMSCTLAIVRVRLPLGDVSLGDASLGDVSLGVVSLGGVFSNDGGFFSKSGLLVAT